MYVAPGVSPSNVPSLRITPAGSLAGHTVDSSHNTSHAIRASSANVWQ